jgi:hypothetical protein
VPERIQLSRKKGWRKPDGAIVVARPSRWGNPYRIAEMAAVHPEASVLELQRMVVGDFRGLVEGRWSRFDDVPFYPPIEAIRYFLAGHDLCCWCPLDVDGQPFPCHADVLLEIANQPAEATR